MSRVQEEHIGENVALTRIGSAPESVGSLDVRDGAHGALCRAGPPPAEDGGCLRVPQGHRGHPEGRQLPLLDGAGRGVERFTADGGDTES